jgi:hypothetical protein
MKKIQCQSYGTGALATIMVTVLSVFLFANATLAFAQAGKTEKAKVMPATKISAVEHTEAQIKLIQDALVITETQKELWNNLTQVMRENAKDMDALTIERRETVKSMNAVDHMKFHRLTTEAHLKQMNKFLPPFEALYASMSDDQKKITDSIFRTGKYAKKKSK